MESQKSVTCLGDETALECLEHSDCSEEWVDDESREINRPFVKPRNWGRTLQPWSQHTGQEVQISLLPGFVNKVLLSQ